MCIGHAIWSLIVGLFIGAVARLFVPGAEHMGLLMTSILGIIGSFVGGFVASLISRPPEGTSFHPAGFVMSVIGAIVVLVAWQHLG